MHDPIRPALSFYVSSPTKTPRLPGTHPSCLPLLCCGLCTVVNECFTQFRMLGSCGLREIPRFEWAIRSSICILRKIRLLTCFVRLPYYDLFPPSYPTHKQVQCPSVELDIEIESRKSGRPPTTPCQKNWPQYSTEKLIGNVAREEGCRGSFCCLNRRFGKDATFLAIHTGGRHDGPTIFNRALVGPGGESIALVAD